jgi:RNA-directed DNA polymerase
VIADRCHQARVVNALEPEWEAGFEPRSYGFRPGRGCHDAIQAVYEVVKGRSPKRLWALDADLAQAFDTLAHDHILAMLGTFPARGMIAQWLKAGVVEQGRLHRTEDGVPQGGVVSPLLLNVALHGMEQAAGVRYEKSGLWGARIATGCPATIRYADDFVVLCHTRQEALEVKARLARWLAPRGLAFNEDKTRVVSLSEGFDFLGFNVRRYGTKPLIKPSKAAIRRIRERLRTELRSLRGSNAPTVIKKLNPIIRGWAAYYRTQVSAEVFDALDQHLWQLTFKWARFSHANKPTRWVVARYWGRFNKARQDRWVFGDRQSGAYLHKFKWTNIVRHRIVMGVASTDDPPLPTTGVNGGARRARRSTRPAGGSSKPRMVAARSAGPCSCPTTTGRKTRTSGSSGWRAPVKGSPRSSSRNPPSPTSTNPVSFTSAAATAAVRHFCPPTSPSGLLEPGARKRARPVLRGAGHRKVSGLPDRSRRGPDRHPWARTRPTRGARGPFGAERG